jgi:hypothetical protein
MTIYYLQDPLPFEFERSMAEEYIVDPVEESASDMWPDPGPCIICGVPHTACVGSPEAE